MTAPPQSLPQQLDETEASLQMIDEAEKILCQHCLRTATNGIKCLGRCVADSNY